MSRFVFRHLYSPTSLHCSPNFHNILYSLRIRPFCETSTSLTSVYSSSDRSSFTVKYLVNSCGLTPERALLASKYVKLQTTNNADSVLTFFKDQGFTETQISKLINCSPPFLLSNPEKTFLPKIEFLKSNGFSSSDIAAIVSQSPGILRGSLKNHLIPFFNFLSDLFQSEEKTIAVFKSCAFVWWFDKAKHFKVNVEMLRQAGVPIKNIRYLVTNKPRAFFTPNDGFKQVVDEVIELGFNPSKLEFVLAVLAFKSMTKSTWDKKVGVYKKWGWSEDDIVAAFKKSTQCMALSEDKITSVMEFWVNKMRLESSLLGHRPIVLSLSLEKRIVPRCEVYQSLVSKGLINPNKRTRLTTILGYPEKLFLERFIDPHKEAAPELTNLYKQTVGCCKTKSGFED